MSDTSYIIRQVLRYQSIIALSVVTALVELEMHLPGFITRLAGHLSLVNADFVATHPN